MIVFFAKYLRKDNVKFVITLFLEAFGFFISNITLIVNAITYKNSLVFFAALFIGIASSIIFIFQIYRRYDFYHGIATQLQKSDQPSYRFCSYVAKTKNRVKDKRTNAFSITKAKITYTISNFEPVFRVNDEVNESLVGLEVQYEFDAIAGSDRVSKIYHTSLRQISGNEIKAQYKFDEEEWNPLKTEPYFHDTNITLWSATKSAQAVSPRKSFSYKLKFFFPNAVMLFYDNRLIVDPKNYANTVGQIKIVVESSADSAGKMFLSPFLQRFYNGMNTDDKRDTLRLTEDRTINNAFSYSITIEPEPDSIYVLTIPSYYKNLHL